MESFEAVTPEHNVENLNGEMNLIAAVEKRSHILEDVDDIGELEMEDVAPSCEVETTSTSNIARKNCMRTSRHQSDNHYGSPFAAQQPKDTQLTSAPPPPPPPPPPPLPPGFPPAVLDSVSNVPDSKLYLSSQEPKSRQSCSPRVQPRCLDAVHENKDSEAQLPRQMFYCSNACPPSDQFTSHFSDRASNGFQPVVGRKGFHLHHPHPASSSQFSYVQEQQIKSRKDITPPPHPNILHTRNAEYGDFYRDRERNKFARRDNIGEYWRPPLPSISGPYYHDSSRMAHAPMSLNGPPSELEVPNSRWKFPPQAMNHRQFRPLPATL